MEVLSLGQCQTDCKSQTIDFRWPATRNGAADLHVEVYLTLFDMIKLERNITHLICLNDTCIHMQSHAYSQVKP